MTRCAVILTLMFASLATAQSPAPSPINTDRPAFADSSVVVPNHTLQMENGCLETAAAGQQTYDLPESLFRFGVAAKTELRFTVPDYYVGVLNGWGDMAIGIKQQLGPIHGFDVSVVATLSLPAGSQSASSHGYDPSLNLPWSRSLSTNWTAAGMLSVYWPTQPSATGNRRNVTGQATFLIDRQLTKPWDAFIEYAGDYPERGGPVHILHLGSSYKLTDNQQVDVHFGVGLSVAAPSHFIGIGYSVRGRL